MYPSLKVQLEVFALVAKKGAVVYYNSDLLRQPTRGCPQHALLQFRIATFRHRDVESQNGRDPLNDFSSLQGLVSVATNAPSSSGCLSLDASFENLRECDLLRSVTSDFLHRSQHSLSQAPQGCSNEARNKKTYVDWGRQVSNIGRT